MPVLTLASLNGTSGLSEGVVTRTVLASLASTLLTMLGLNARAGTLALRTDVRDAATDSAVRSVPSWNLTPSRMVKSHSSGEACFHSVARKGTTFPWAESYFVRVSRQPERDRMYAASDSRAQFATGARKLSTTIRWLVSATLLAPLVPPPLSPQPVRAVRAASPIAESWPSLRTGTA